MNTFSSDSNYRKEPSMTTQQSTNLRAGWHEIVFVLLMLVFLLAAARAGSAPADVKQQVFHSPEDATKALIDAAKTKDQVALAAVFGPEYATLRSGDEVQENKELEQFAAALDKSAHLQKNGDTRATLNIGEDNWPFPVPLVQQNGQWRFDTKAGMEELLNRRIGENELSAIGTCRAYVLAQWEYFTEGDHDNDGVAEYAQHFFSAPGTKNGLYWDTADGDKPSPMGALVAAARAEGYSAGQHRNAAATQAPPQRHPFHGYYFRIIKAQGPHAPGGKYNYIINGNMIAGYALIAYPDKWGSSGVMTFIVNQQGRVYQKNLGLNTGKLAETITEYDPDTSWKLVKE
jgi:Skp family chaperone for outer membrane proteins